MLNLFSNNVKLFFSSKKNSQRNFVSIKLVLTIISNQFNLNFFSSPALSANFVNIRYF